MSLKPWGVRRLVRGLWVRVMRDMCPDGFTVAVKGAVFGTRSGLALVVAAAAAGMQLAARRDGRMGSGQLLWGE